MGVLGDLRPPNTPYLYPLTTAFPKELKRKRFAGVCPANPVKSFHEAIRNRLCRYQGANLLAL